MKLILITTQTRCQSWSIKNKIGPPKQSFVLNVFMKLFRFIKVVRYNTSKKSKTHTNQVASLCKDEWNAGKTEMWTGERLIIPSVPPSYLIGCDIIEISYVLEVVSNSRRYYII